MCVPLQDYDHGMSALHVASARRLTSTAAELLSTRVRASSAIKDLVGSGVRRRNGHVFFFAGCKNTSFRNICVVRYKGNSSNAV